MKHPVILVHPAIQPYRVDLFQLLERDLGVRILFVGWAEHNLRMAPAAGLTNWQVFTARGLGPYRDGVSARILGEAATEDYGVWISSALSWFPTQAAFPIVRARRKPFVLWTEDWWWPTIPGKRYIQAYGRTILRQSKAVIVSGSAAKHFALKNGTRADRIRIAPNATEDLARRATSEEEVRLVRTELAGSSADFVFLYLNRIVPYKGLDLLLRAFSSIERAWPGARLAVIGDGPYRAECENLAQGLGLRHVHFLGSVDHERIHLMYRACDMYVHPARFLPKGRVRAEAWGFTVNEAMSVGCPVLASTAVAAAVDLIVDGRTGFLVPPNDVAALRDRMISVLERPEFLSRMRNATVAQVSRITARQQFEQFREAVDLAKTPSL